MRNNKVCIKQEFASFLFIIYKTSVPVKAQCHSCTAAWSEKLFENTVEKQNEKMQVLENKLKDFDLKTHEQNKEMDILKRKLRVLKEKESKVTDL